MVGSCLGMSEKDVCANDSVNGAVTDLGKKQTNICTEVRGDLLGVPTQPSQ